MSQNTYSTLSDDLKGSINISIWDQEDNKSTYYNRKLDTQGIVPGHSMEEAIQAFNEEYGLQL